MADGGAFWDWREALLKHPDGRAKGGEPCVKCGDPVPPNAPWQQRDRHVCSTRCNLNLSRQFNRIIRDRGAELDFHGREIGAPKPLANPRISGPRIFRTLPDPSNRYESEGFGPIPGDIVERHGVRTTYLLQHRDEHGLWMEEMGEHLLVAAALNGLGHPVRLLICGANPDGTMKCIVWGSAAPGEPLNLGDLSNFAVDGIECEWQLETIRDATPTIGSSTGRHPSRCRPGHHTNAGTGPWRDVTSANGASGRRPTRSATLAAYDWGTRRSSRSTRAGSTTATDGSAASVVSQWIPRPSTRTRCAPVWTTSSRWWRAESTRGPTPSWRTGTATCARARRCSDEAISCSSVPAHRLDIPGGLTEGQSPRRATNASGRRRTWELEREAHMREVQRYSQNLPENSYGRRNRQAIADRETRIAERLRAIERAYTLVRPPALAARAGAQV